ncbi:MAG: hypothetical protein EOP73_30010, partial [Variovorax sp.]
MSCAIVAASLPETPGARPVSTRLPCVPAMLTTLPPVPPPMLITPDPFPPACWTIPTVPWSIASASLADAVLPAVRVRSIAPTVLVRSLYDLPWTENAGATARPVSGSKTFWPKAVFTPAST